MTATNGTAKFSNLAQGLAALVGASAVVAGGMYGLAVAPLQNRVPAFAQSTPKSVQAITNALADFINA